MPSIPNTGNQSPAERPFLRPFSTRRQSGNFTGMRTALNVRQERFCELIAAGESATEAWLKAGYKVSRQVAGVNAHESLKNPKIKARITELRKPQTKAALLTRDRKREILYRIVTDPTMPIDARLRAIAEDNKMAGHYEPDRVEVEAGPKTLLSIKERAAQVSAALARRYQPPAAS
jgi:hypothetical protein